MWTIWIIWWFRWKNIQRRREDNWNIHRRIYGKSNTDAKTIDESYADAKTNLPLGWRYETVFSVLFGQCSGCERCFKTKRNSFFHEICPSVYFVTQKIVRKCKFFFFFIWERIYTLRTFFSLLLPFPSSISKTHSAWGWFPAFSFHPKDEHLSL